MAFGQAYEAAKNNAASENRESPYLRFKPGERVVRLLDDDAVTFWQYFLDVNVGGRQVGRSVIVGGARNPIREYMDSLGDKHPNYRKPSRKFLIHVYDRTPILRVAGSTFYADEKGNFPAEAANAKDGDGFPYMQTPNNRIMLMEYGTSMMDDLGNLHNRIRDPESGKPLAIQEFDIHIFVRGTGRDTKKSLVPSTSRDAMKPLADEIKNGARYDIGKITRPMPDSAQERLIAGEDYNEVSRSLGWEPLKPLW